MFQPFRLAHQVFGEMARLQHLRLWLCSLHVRPPHRRKRTLCKVCSAACDPEQPQEWRCSRERGIPVFRQRFEKPAARLFQRRDARFEALAHLAEGGFVRGLDAANSLLKPSDKSVNRLSAVQRHFPRDKIDGLNAVRALVDRGDPRIAIMLRGARLLDVTHAAMHLDAFGGDLHAGIG